MEKYVLLHCSTTLHYAPLSELRSAVQRARRAHEFDPRKTRSLNENVITLCGTSVEWYGSTLRHALREDEGYSGAICGDCECTADEMDETLRPSKTVLIAKAMLRITGAETIRGDEIRALW